MTELEKIRIELVALTERLEKDIKRKEIKEDPKLRGIMKGEPIIAIRAGHGGIDPVTGEYTTKGKQFKHPLNLPIELHHKDETGKTFYEGVWNRTIADMVYLKLWRKGIPSVMIHHEWKDLPLMSQAKKVNEVHKNNPIALLLELHGNSSQSHRARGFEVFTSPGESLSDFYADVLYEKIESSFNYKMRADFSSDDDSDKEAKFTMLTKTIPPAILPEFLFFDNFTDVKHQMNKDVIEKYTDILTDVGAIAYEREKKKYNGGN